VSRPAGRDPIEIGFRAPEAAAGEGRHPTVFRPI
jgi:hypothetical protein